MSYKRKLGPKSQKRVDALLDIIAKEHIDIQEGISVLLPAKIRLSKLHVKSTEELALLTYAREQGLPYNTPNFDFKKVKPTCPYCGENTKITKISNKKNSYLCNPCNKKFTPNKDSIISGSKEDAITWMQTLLCLLEGYTIDRTCMYCNYAKKTYYYIRNRLFYAMKLFMEEVKLYGEVQCDNTEVHISFRGQNLKDSDYPEDSPFYIEDFVPRAPRKRGGSYKRSELSMNKIPIFTAVDAHGHVLARQAGIGATTYSTIATAVGENKILLQVPPKDPFEFSRKTNAADGEIIDTLLISDGELSIKKYAEKVGLKHEAHVYRRDNKQVKLSNDAHNIQKINYIHKELKKFLKQINSSTKYLPGYLTLFEFKMNTGASDKAIEHLFEILVTPGLGKSSDFYDDLFSVPNYIVEWSKKDTPLKKFDYNQLYCAYLYHKKQIAADEFQISLKEIFEETGYSVSSIRRIYKNYKSSGLMDDIVEHFEGEKPRKKKNIPPELIAILNEFATNRNLPRKQRKTIKEFLDGANKRYNTSYKQSIFLYYVKQRQDLGITQEIKSVKGNILNGEKYSDMQIETGYRIYTRYGEIYKSLRADNINPKKKDIFIRLANEEALSVAYVQSLYYYIKKVESSKT